MADPLDHNTPQPPASWQHAGGLAQRALAPVERFLAIEAASGIVLIVAAAVALIWANSPWHETYNALWHAPVGLRISSFHIERDLHFWINDGLMTIFFFVVGLEIRREIYNGELSELRRAALPFVAAVGGMLVPASIFVAFNLGRESVSGWGIPMATDIAFAVGVLALLGSRVPPALRVFLLALAVIDDVGAILVIAIFYSSGLHPSGFFIAAGGVGVIVLMRLLGIRSPWAYVPPAAIVWAGTYVAGIHPTLAGAVIGLMTPVRPSLGRRKFIERARATLARLRDQRDSDTRALLPHMRELDQARREALSPVDRIDHALHGWVAFGVMPLFALANAGVSVGDLSLSGEPLLVLLGIGVGLILGKPIGILAFSWLATRLGFAALPRGIAWPQVAVVGVAAGIGFTMSIFIASLAFPAGPNLETSKLGILIGSAAAAIVAMVFGGVILASKPVAEITATVSDEVIR
ncbi:MAG TPA: Na+/H+ antiporter NhaA [Burkholderiales bacterium]|nr:Na+/H+ antiporter NhaA [Burkholderiales bacterium]